MRCRLIFVGLLTCLCALYADPPGAGTAGIDSALVQIHAASLRDDLKFIASDELAGRDSPSPGLDRAADYIAEQFRGAGLEPAVDGSYFQAAPMLVEEQDSNNLSLTISSDRGQFTASRKNMAVRIASALQLKDAPVFKIDPADEAAVRSLTADQTKDRVVILEYDRRKMRSVSRKLRTGKPSLLILVDRRGITTHESRPRQLIDPSEADSEPVTPRITLIGQDAARFFAGMKPAEGGAKITVQVAAPHRTAATMRNVIGVLRGSDPALRDTYVLLTAHYDHLGVKPDGPGHRIYNGANDDGSGTVSVMEVARALARLPRHPRRSIVFMTFFGEEEGLVGSEYYAHHPVFPLDKTIADLNLEQVGRTDSTEGRQLSNASLTGFDYSDITRFVEQAGGRTGIRVYKNAKGSDDYFGASDNYSLAEKGVPAETLCVAFDYRDYHRVGDEWQKIDYDNMAKVDRAVALAVYLMADSEQPVQWNEANPKTEPYVKAQRPARE
ncbi:MAG TPA: M28 family peptidase [Bryobacteraceae bacterium]|nr:M28 family peptidase [Bryobacteraceae bacterium]